MLQFKSQPPDYDIPNTGLTGQRKKRMTTKFTTKKSDRRENWERELTKLFKRLAERNVIVRALQLFC